MRFTFTEANLLPDKHAENIRYNEFLELFGEEGNVLVLAVQNPELFSKGRLEAWNQLSKELGSFEEIDFTITKDKKNKSFVLDSLTNYKFSSKKAVENFQKNLFHHYPFYENILFSENRETIQTAIYLKKEIINNAERIQFINEVFIPKVKMFEKDTKIDVRISGMPYIRTMNAQNIMDEIGKFVVIAICVTILLFFFFFRSFRATIITLTVVIIGVMWALGILGLFKFEITVLTGLIPPLIIVIGVPNCIFLINKYQHEVNKHGNQARSLQRVISKIGNATLMTNITTACGFATFILTDSEILQEFGLVASVNIMLIFILSILLIPIIYSFMPLPKEKHLKHLNNIWLNNFVYFLSLTVKKYRIQVFITSILCLCISIIGVYKIKLSGNMIEDMPKTKAFYKDIKFFEKEFGGIMPLEILIDTKKEKGVMKLSTLKRMDKINEVIESFPELSRPVSVVNLVKYSKQAFYKGNPKYYQLPTSQEQSYIFEYTKNSDGNSDMLNNFVDSTGQYARITTMMGEINTERMEGIEASLIKGIELYFPKERYDVTLTGKTLGYLKGLQF